MYSIKSLIQYRPMKVGKAEIIYDEKNKSFGFFYNKKPWMGYDPETSWQACEFIIEISEANGTCITSGLGMGILQTHLCINEKVNKIIVYEKNKDVIDMFIENCKENNFNIEKIFFVNDDANNMSGTVSDCLFLDHFESEKDREIIESVKEISNNNKTNFLWFWPAPHHYFKYVLLKNLKISLESYKMWVDYIKVPQIPKVITEKNLNFLKDLNLKYIDDVKNISLLKSSLIKLEKRRTYIQKLKELKNNL